MRLVAEDSLCPPWYGPWRPTQADDALAPAPKLILKASTQHPEELAAEFTAALQDPEVSRQVYFLRLAGWDGHAPLRDNLAARLPADHKLLRYLRGRQRCCQQQQAEQYRLTLADGQFCAGILFATIDATLSVVGMPIVQASGSVLSDAQLVAKLQEQGPQLRAEIPNDACKQPISGLRAHPDWHVSETAPLTFPT